MLTNYIKIAWKVLLRHPFYTFITLFGISLTLSVLMVITSFLDHLIGAHYPETNRNRTLYIERMELATANGNSSMSGPMSFGFLTDYAKTLKTPERVTLFSDTRNSNAYVGSQKIKLATRFTDANFWYVNEFEFLEGKPYNDEKVAKGDHVAVITNGFKAYYFGSNTEPVVGETIEIENLRYKVIGVVRGSPLTRLFTHSDVYFPYTSPKSNFQSAGLRGDYEAMLLAKNPADLTAIQDEFQSHRLNRFMHRFVDVVRLPQPQKRPANLGEIAQNDVEQLEQVLVNVIKNALEACETGQRVEVISAAQHLSIRDNGRGIPEAIEANLFNPFYSTKPDGQGIGLTVTREILLNHQFSFSLKTNPDGWTEFRIAFA